MKDFFISYNRHDRTWAEWIAWTLEEAGYTTVIQAWDFRAGGNFVLDMQKAASEAERTIAVLSETYLASGFTQPEWAAAFAQDPTGKDRRLIPVRVKECQLSGLLRPIVYIDLVDVAEAEAQEVLLRSLSQDRAKPDQKPRFPGSAVAQNNRPKPVFPPSIPSNLPLTSAIFIGRDDELEQLHAQMQLQATIAISAVSGMGGIGKTELAAQYALQQRDMGTYPGGICWLRAREDLSTQIVLFARSHLGLTIPEDLELAQQVSHCWRNWHPGETLIVLDDVQRYEDIVPVLPPQRSQFRVLLTTRLTLGSPVQNFQITVLSEEKAIELLRAFVLDGRIDQDLATAKQICQWLGYLPLGLELVGRYLAEDEDLLLQDLWQELQDKRIEAEALRQAAAEMTASLGVLAAFELSWEKLTAEAQQLAAVLSLFALVEIPWNLVEQCLPDVNQAELKKLRSKQLLKLNLLRRVDQGMYQLHQLLREFFAAKRSQRADDPALQQQFYQVVIAEAERVEEKPERSLIKESTIMIAHLQAAIERLSRPEQALDLATCSNWIAELYHSQGRYGEAEPLYVRSLSIYEQQLGAQHPDVATSLNNLASLYRAQGRYGEAEPLYVRSLELREQQLGAQHPDVARSLNNLAALYKSQGRYREAEPLYVRSLELREQQLGAQHPDVARSLNNLAALYDSQGRYGEAEPLYVRSLSIYEQQLGAQHPDVARSLNNLAALYDSQGRYGEAEPLYVQSLELREQQLGAQHPDVATSLNNLALLYYSQGRYGEAEPLYVRSLSIYEQQLGAQHPDVATSLNNLALLYYSQGRYGEAEPLYVRSLELREQQLGAQHPDVAQSLSNLARLYHLQERYSEAESLFQRSLSIFQNQLPADHPSTARVVSNLAHLYNSQGRYPEAESLYLQALPILSTRLEENHPWRQDATNNWRSFLQKAIEAQRTNELSDNPMTQDLLRQMQTENNNA
jgi:Flp pilus assembly protein TadD